MRAIKMTSEDIDAKRRAENARDEEFFTLITQELSDGARLTKGPIPQPKCLWEMVVTTTGRLRGAFREGNIDHPKIYNLIEADKELERAIEAVRKSALPPRVSHRLADKLRDTSEGAAWRESEVSISIAFIMGLMAEKHRPLLSDTYSNYKILPEVK